MYPLPIPAELGPARINTDERRAVARALTDALYDYLTLPIAEMERAYAQQSKTPRVTVEGVVRMQDEINRRRDELAANHEKVTVAIASVPQGMEEMVKLQLESILITPLEKEISGLETFLSQMQAELEKGVPANAE